MEQFLSWDLAVLDWIAQHVQSDAMDQLVPIISSLGDKGIVWVLLVIILICIPKERATGIQILLAMGCSVVFCNLLLKNLVGRIRPFELVAGLELLIRAPHDYSFPSGHTSAAFAAATVMFLCRTKMRYFMLGFALLMGFSRLYLYVHYFTDILGGVVTGIVAGYIGVKCYQLIAAAIDKRRRRLPP